MSIATLLHNIGDIIEGLEKDVGFSDATTKAIRADGAAVLSAFATKWASDSKLNLLSLAKSYVSAVLADPATFVSQSEALLDQATSSEIQITIDDAKDALRTALIAATPATAS